MAHLDPVDDAADLGTTARLAESLHWLIRLRWIAVGGVTVVVALAALAGSVVALAPLIGVVALLGSANAAFAWRAGRVDENTPPAAIERAILAQILFDLVCLTAFLRWSGGTDNPFASFYVFHAALAAMLLPLRRAILVGTVAVLFHASELVATALDLIDHVPVLFGPTHLHEALHGMMSWRSSAFVIAYLVAFATTQFGVVYFVGTLAQRQREAERRRIHHEQVARSRERLARIGAIAAGVAHSVRNPLHGLLSCVDILKGTPGADEDILALMDEGVRRIDRVTGSLLSLGRDEPRQVTPTDLTELGENAARLVRVTARDRDVQIEVSRSGELGTRPVDADRLTETLVNLLDNAVHASPAGSTVELLLERDSATGAVRFEVLDRGVGIPEEMRERVFDAFFTTKPVGEGTGLGLAIARRVVEEHGGEVHVEARPGGGTRVIATLPAQDAP